jgi:hypothetical protein
MPSPVTIEASQCARTRLTARLLFMALFLSSGAQAEEPVPATVSCTPRVGKGRVQCEVTLSVATGRLTWADAVVLETPSFAAALRDRVGPRGAAERSQERIRLPFALLAQGAGAGPITVKARTVWCHTSQSTVRPGQVAQERCVTVSHTVSAEVQVTPEVAVAPAAPVGK